MQKMTKLYMKTKLLSEEEKKGQRRWLQQNQRQLGDADEDETAIKIKDRKGREMQNSNMIVCVCAVSQPQQLGAMP